ncbi:choice-of-anchor A family protein [Colwellia sp. 1_MG-2023]|uniref:collagen-binding domain-containing protein n=1 Tax=unclassified Colwellia TaxID=196834 RepID=UPI001C097106|nr:MULTISPECIES: collagen-binding domain-containing protein [unclassified Colwellia]MBU2925456.1 choice-of-anchor A family protein [Colwellia sp. C2M11]MDO6651576.1 choice-of-anchor A family protein [Colwellia sp. 3_MG-2023]MDO6665026.1 choice-of-anchor A family protein [Colwellia sp. 2_MG-2023]MDO6689399.1 choice-of-anchor A family protein [Colwellia sp. 1_MG-2023]
MKKFISILSGLFLLASVTANASEFILNEYNVITIEDFEGLGGTHVDGKTFVGGNYTGLKSDFGQRLDQNSRSDITALTVAGSINAQVGVYVHDTVLSSEKNIVTAAINSNQVLINSTLIDSKIDNVKLTTGLDAIKADYKAQLENSSAYFSSLAANSKIETNGNNKTFAIDKGLNTDNDIAVFTLDGSTNIFDLNNLSLSMTGDNANDLAYIVINVPGNDVSMLNNSNMNFDKNKFGSKIIWNFYEAEVITLNAQNFVGALLAPYATVTQTGGNIDGSVGVLSLITNAEIHLATNVDVTVPAPSAGRPVTQVPEPSSIVLMLLAMTGLIYQRKKLNV